MPASALRQSEAGVEMKRSPCPVCKRRFPEDRLKVHEDICRNISKKRPVYNATAHRLNGVATDQEIKKIIREKTKPTELDILLKLQDFPEPKYMKWTAKLPPDPTKTPNCPRFLGENHT
uniref:UPF0418 protein T03G11.3 n=1 Tax=Lygus hesperus TaxID=30085 RepID=A0A0A9WQL9_LYGHE